MTRLRMSFAAPAFVAALASLPVACLLSVDETLVDRPATDASSGSDDGASVPDGPLEDAAGGDASDAGFADAPVVARDSFDREVDGGLGVADLGGPWTILAGPASRISAQEGRAVLLSVVGVVGAVQLADVTARDVDVTATLAMDELADGALTVGLDARFFARASADGAEYYALSVFTSRTGKVKPQLLRSGKSLVSGVPELPVAYVPRADLRIRLQVDGVAPAHLRAKVWPAKEPEPSAWTIRADDDVPDASSSLRGPGAVGMSSYLTGNSTNTVRTRVDDLEVRELR